VWGPPKWMTCSPLVRGTYLRVTGISVPRVVRADDEPQLLAGVDVQADGKHVDLDVRDLAGCSFSTRIGMEWPSSTRGSLTLRCRGIDREVSAIAAAWPCKCAYAGWMCETIPR
jgi:hypothetical protein